jgi:hypothetical protein
MLLDFKAGKWETLAGIEDGTIIGYVCWSHDGDYVYFNTIGKTGLSIYRTGLRDRKPELMANLEERASYRKRRRMVRPGTGRFHAGAAGYQHSGDLRARRRFPIGRGPSIF